MTVPRAAATVPEADQSAALGERPAPVAAAAQLGRLATRRDVPAPPAAANAGSPSAVGSLAGRHFRPRRRRLFRRPRPRGSPGLCAVQVPAPSLGPAGRGLHPEHKLLAAPLLSKKPDLLARHSRPSRPGSCPPHIFRGAPAVRPAPVPVLMYRRRRLPEGFPPPLTPPGLRQLDVPSHFALTTPGIHLDYRPFAWFGSFFPTRLWTCQW